MQVDTDDIIGFKFVRDFAVAYAGDHGCQVFSVLYEVFLANRVVEPFTDGDIGELDPAAWGRRAHGR